MVLVCSYYVFFRISSPLESLFTCGPSSIISTGPPDLDDNCKDLDLSIWIIINLPVFCNYFMMAMISFWIAYIAVMESVELIEIGFLHHCLYFCFYVPFRIARQLWMGHEIETDRETEKTKARPGSVAN